MLRVLLAAVFVLLLAVVSLQLLRGGASSGATVDAVPGQSSATGATPAQAEQGAIARVTSGIAAAQQTAQDRRNQADAP